MSNAPINGVSKRVALLARPGVACDRLRGALAQAGAQLVLEGDPATLDPSALDAAQAQVLLVALDAQTEEALDRFDSVMHDPTIEVIFEEAELAARREGWEAARWVRHLAAKLHRHSDVLPPGSEKPNAEFADDALEAMSVQPAAFDLVPVMPSSDSASEAIYDGGFDPVAAETAGLDTPASEVVPFTFASDFVMSLDELRTERTVTADNDQVANFSFDSDVATSTQDALDDTDIVALEADTSISLDATGYEADAMELVLDEDPSELRGGESTAAGRDADHRFRHDLDELDRRISSMELVDDRVVKGPAQANGAVLVLSGIGGPDAVRQLLGALPEDFARPVLVQQRLDGGRFDKLVAQMQRATPLQVKLAEPGLHAIAGVVYIVPADVGITVGDIDMQFIAGGDGLLAALPSADSAVLLLSGSDPALVDAVMNHSWAGALVAGQAPDGCYDAAASSALIARGGSAGQPAELAQRLAERWRS